MTQTKHPLTILPLHRLSSLKHSYTQARLEGEARGGGAEGVAALCQAARPAASLSRLTTLRAPEPYATPAGPFDSLLSKRGPSPTYPSRSPLDPHVHEKADVDYPIPSPRDPSASGDDASRLNQGQEGEVRRGGREEARESYLDTPK